jgi:desulfoferrodoxin
MLHFYHCKICGNVVILTVNGGGKLSCCGEFMTLLEANTSDGAGEKHVPVVEVKGNKVLVKVSSVAHCNMQHANGPISEKLFPPPFNARETNSLSV